MVKKSYNRGSNNYNRILKIIMAAVEVGVQQVKHFNTDALILFLSKHGISQNGLKALRGKFPTKH